MFFPYFLSNIWKNTRIFLLLLNSFKYLFNISSKTCTFKSSPSSFHPPSSTPFEPGIEKRGYSIPFIIATKRSDPYLEDYKSENGEALKNGRAINNKPRDEGGEPRNLEGGVGREGTARR